MCGRKALVRADSVQNVITLSLDRFSEAGEGAITNPCYCSCEQIVLWVYWNQRILLGLNCFVPQVSARFSTVFQTNYTFQHISILQWNCTSIFVSGTYGRLRTVGQWKARTDRQPRIEFDRLQSSQRFIAWLPALQSRIRQFASRWRIQTTYRYNNNK